MNLERKPSEKRVRFTFAGSVLGTQAAFERHLVCLGWLIQRQFPQKLAKRVNTQLQGLRVLTEGDSLRPSSEPEVPSQSPDLRFDFLHFPKGMAGCSALKPRG